MHHLSPQLGIWRLASSSPTLVFLLPFRDNPLQSRRDQTIPHPMSHVVERPLLAHHYPDLRSFRFHSAQLDSVRKAMNSSRQCSEGGCCESASHTDSRHGGLTRRQGSRDCWGTGTGEIVDPLYEDFVIAPAAGSLLSARFATRPLTVTEAGVSGLERSLAGRPSASVCWQHDSIRPLSHAATESPDRNAEVRAGRPLRYPATAHSTSSHPQGVNAWVSD